MSDAIRRKELADFLKNRRQRRSPEEVGLPPGSGARRRAAGLRREEVAALAGISLHWYTALEQGRDIRVSDSVLESLVRTLRLQRDERDHLYRLAGRNVPLESFAAADPAASDPDLTRIVEQFGAIPAYAIDGQWNLLTWNRAAEELFGGFRYACAKSGNTNLLWLLFTDLALRGRLADWEASASQLVAAFRTAYARRLDDPCVSEIVRDLGDASSEFTAMWERHDVRCLRDNLFRFAHPAAGEIALRSNAFYAAERHEVTLVAYTPVEAADGERLAKLTDAPATAAPSSR
ncbi:helix-turn-helix domain-containing protein [Paenibacillus sp. MWE-103]|uniref:Helix-turn-helix domain-containing protein n=1 Tax=Paenibacillus artemisiicola TaxID=1172618 RepID=A0ABS3W454_9BACL|nr:helix-turn-helix transcriptional regulator [Paenibacillus artemisiicola]MBO7742930.1 helix-turn-helix domain-containing protein [Paenibacillus artemisiicola]